MTKTRIIMRLCQKIKSLIKTNKNFSDTPNLQDESYGKDKVNVGDNWIIQ